MQTKQEKDRKFRDEMIKLKVFCQHPNKGMTDCKVYVHNDSTLEEVTSEAHNVRVYVSTYKYEVRPEVSSVRVE